MSNAADAIERAILDGVDTASSSTYREDLRAAAKTDKSPLNTDDELGSDLPSDDDDDDDEGLYDRDDDDVDRLPTTTTSSHAARGVSDIQGVRRAATKGGATNTGPKGVLRDQQMQAERDRRARVASVQAVNSRMEKLAFTSETYAEQVAREKSEANARLRAENRDSDDEEHDDEGGAVSKEAIADLKAKERRREVRLAQLRAQHQQQAQQVPQQQQQSNTLPSKLLSRTTSTTADRWFGHLREVDERGYVSAIDSEHASVPVVIHIYSKAVEECNILTHSLSSLARLYPRTKFLQVQAAAIGFGASSSTTPCSTFSSVRRNEVNADDEDDDEVAEEGEYDEYDPKSLEVLPTLLVYRAGKLVANLVRIDLDEDWKDGGEQSIRNILTKYDALVAADDSKHNPSLTIDTDDGVDDD